MSDTNERLQILIDTADAMAAKKIDKLKTFELTWQTLESGDVQSIYVPCIKVEFFD